VVCSGNQFAWLPIACVRGQPPPEPVVLPCYTKHWPWLQGSCSQRGRKVLHSRWPLTMAAALHLDGMDWTAVSSLHKTAVQTGWTGATDKFRCRQTG
jgi:hypothetical protein